MITWLDVTRVWVAVAVLILLLVWELRLFGRYLASKNNHRDCAWRPHTEHPTYQPATAVIAFVSDEDGRAFCAGEPYAWDGSELCSEIDGAPLTDKAFWWMDESALLAQLPTSARSSLK